MFKCIKTPEELNTGLDLYAFNPPLIKEGFISLWMEGSAPIKFDKIS